MEAATSRLAANLLALGLRPGDRVATLTPNRPALLIFYMACFKAGLVVTSPDYRQIPSRLAHFPA